MQSNNFRWWKHKSIRKWFCISLLGLTEIFIVPIITMQFFDPKSIPDEPKIIMILIGGIICGFGFFMVMRWEQKLRIGMFRK